jgi:hypothetical protein
MKNAFIHFEIRENKRTAGAYNVFVVPEFGAAIALTMNSTLAVAEIHLAAFEAAAEAN